MLSTGTAASLLSGVVNAGHDDVGAAVGNAVGMDVPHVGTASDDQPTEPTPATVHVRVVAALIANPAKQ